MIWKSYQKSIRMTFFDSHHIHGQIIGRVSTGRLAIIAKTAHKHRKKDRAIGMSRIAYDRAIGMFRIAYDRAIGMFRIAYDRAIGMSRIAYDRAG